MTEPNAAEPRYAQLVREAAAKLQAHVGPIVIAAHIDPDGDALGSCLGLQRALRAIGKDAQMYMQVPHYLTFLPQPGEVLTRLESWPAGALAVIVDVDNADAARVAGVDLKQFAGEVLNLDHHGTNCRQATVSLVDPSKAAAAMIVKDVMETLEVPWSAELATPLLLGTSTDTGNFRFSNTTPEVLRVAADLVEHGAQLAWLNDQLARNPRRYYALLSEVLTQMQFSHDGLVVSSRINDEALERANATWEDVESYVNTLRNADGAELAVMFKDYGHRVKLSLRSRGRVSAQNIAVALSGGGHVAAAGANIDGSYAHALSLFDAVAEEEFKRVGLR